VIGVSLDGEKSLGINFEVLERGVDLKPGGD
jgi:hypothetical protein